ncbi:MAG: hypothetical protein ACQ9ET_03570 [Nitrosomonadaceae bacterium]
MFGLGKKRKVERECADIIGQQLHGQINCAFENNEGSTGERLTSAFVAGYLYGFIGFGFVMNGIHGNRLIDRHLKYICNGVIPGRLYEIFRRNLSILEMEKGLDGRKKTAEFETGTEVGIYDSGTFCEYEDIEGNNLYKYLIGEELKYTVMQRQEGVDGVGRKNQIYIDSVEFDTG